MTDGQGQSARKGAPLPGVSVEDLLAAASYRAPALEDDPAARILGLVPDPSVRFDGRALKRFRTRAGLQLPQLVQKLASRGWEVRNADALGWESNRSGAIAPALIAAVAEILGVAQDTLATTAQADDPLMALRSTAKFRELAERMSKTLSLPLGVATARLETSAAAAVHRGEAPDPDGTLRSLESLVEALEGRRP